MSLLARAGHSFRWRPDLECEISDLVRWVEADGKHLAVLANGYECGWSACWPKGSRLLLDLFAEAWGGQDLASLVASVSSEFNQRVSSMVPDPDIAPEDHEDLGGDPAGIFVAVEIDGSTGRARWIGSGSAVLTRKFEVAQRTAPHSFVEEARSKGFSRPEKLPDVLTRYLGPGREDETETADFEFRARDMLLLVNHGVQRALTLDDLAYLATCFASPRVLADEVSRLAFEHGDVTYTAVIAIRFENDELAPIVEALIGEYDPDPRHEPWLKDYAHQHQVLPVQFDMGGVMAIRPDGAVVTFGWETPGDAPVLEVRPWLNVTARNLAAHRYPDLAVVSPTRPDSANDCAKCDEWRQTDAGKDEAIGCPFCGYLGWVLPEPSDELAQWTGLKLEVSRPPARPWWKLWK